MHSEWGEIFGCNICLLKRVMFIVCSIIASGDDHCG